jgi:NAD(P)H-dependent flavin oxidoreductase YrpB (nitropropane dioxygenase family)
MGARLGGRAVAVMIRTRLTELLAIRHPIVLGGMAGGTSPELVAAVSNAGGLGIFGASRRSPDEARELGARIRSLTNAPFGMNLLLFESGDDLLDAVLACRPRVLSTGWRRPDQDLRGVAERAHAQGALFMHQADTLEEAKHAAAAGADLVVAQGTEGGGHVGLMATLPLARMVVRALAPLPVIAAGGIADGPGIAAALLLGAQGVLLGTRLLATTESPLPEGYKRAIVASDGHDTLLSEIPDIVTGRVWPGAYARVRRNAFVEQWLGREGELRRHQREVQAQVQAARAAGDADRGSLLIGQDAGLVDAIEPGGALIERLAAEAEEALRTRSRELLG